MRFLYHCAQNQQRQQDARKKKDAKPRDKLPMPAFECRGWLHVTVSDSSSAVVVKLKHDAAHAPYFDINMPPEITAYVAKNHELPLVQVIIVCILLVFIISQGQLLSTTETRFGQIFGRCIRLRKRRPRSYEKLSTISGQQRRVKSGSATKMRSHQQRYY